MEQKTTPETGRMIAALQLINEIHDNVSKALSETYGEEQAQKLMGETFTPALNGLEKSIDELMCGLIHEHISDNEFLKTGRI